MQRELGGAVSEPKPQLLIVDDEPLILMMLVDAFEEAGFVITASSNGEDAIKQLELWNFAAVVTDIRLGAGPSGWDVARVARQRDPSILVIYMTGDSGADWVSEGISKSVIVQKPFSLTRMLNAVADLSKTVVQPRHGAVASF